MCVVYEVINKKDVPIRLGLQKMFSIFACDFSHEKWRVYWSIPVMSNVFSDEFGSSRIAGESGTEPNVCVSAFIRCLMLSPTNVVPNMTGTFEEVSEV